MPQIYTINPNTQHKKRLTSTKDGQASLIYVTMYLLFPDKYINRRTGKIPVLAYLVLKETFVRSLIHCGKLQKNTKEGTLPAGSWVIYLILIYLPFHAGGG